MNDKKQLFRYLIILLGLLASFATGFFLQEFLGVYQGNWTILNQAYSILSDHGLKTMPPENDLEYGMIRGLVQAYNDPYTIFVEPAAHELESDTLKGSFGGIGVRLDRDSQGYILVYPFPESPAASSGIMEGDRLFAVDDLTVTPEVSIQTVQAQLRGPVSSRVNVLIGHQPDYIPERLIIKRAEIPLPSVTWHLHPQDERVGIVEINVIAASTTTEIQKAIQDMRDRGAGQFILDLRDNFGGLLDAGVDVARLFLEEGMIIQHQYRGEEVKTYNADREGPLSDLPLAVLINQNTASAAEVIAGSFKARGRAVLIGNPTYGKDTIQLVFDLDDNSSLHVTAARWWVPSLEPPIGDKGVQPDITIDPPQEEIVPDPYVAAAIDYFKEK